MNDAFTRVILLAGLITQIGSAAAPPTPELPIEEHLCRVVGLGTDPDRLIGYLRQRSPSAEDERHADRLAVKLGDDSQEVRREAMARLEQLGSVAEPALKKAEKSDDLEVRRNATLVLKRLSERQAAERDLTAPLSQAVVRMLARLRPTGAAAALARYVPFADCAETELELYYALDALMPPSDLQRLAANPAAARRAVAACLLGKSADARLRAVARRCLDDRDPTVRLRAAQGLLAAAEPDKAVLPVLVGLLEDTPLDVAWQAEELLRFAGGRRLPEAVVGAGTAAERKRSTEAWRGWWRDNGGGLDLSGMHRGGRRPGLVLASTEDSKHTLGRLCLYGCDAKPRHQVPYPSRVKGFAARADGGTLVAYHDLAARSYVAAEHGPDGTVRWKTALDRVSDGWIGVTPIPGGRWLVASGRAIVEFDEAGRPVRKSEAHRDLGCSSAQIGPDGLLYLTKYHHQRGGAWLITRTCRAWDGKLLNKIDFDMQMVDGYFRPNWRMSRDGTVFAPEFPFEKYHLVEFTRYGRRVREFPEWSAGAVRLRDGRTLLKSGYRLAEARQDGSVIWEVKTDLAVSFMEAVYPVLRYGFVHD